MTVFLPALASLSRDDLDAEVGPGVVDRGVAYARSGAVTALTTGDHGHLLLANVRGSNGRFYRTMVALDDSETDAIFWHGQCTCPVGNECKHVLAVVWTARDRVLQRASESGSTRGWRQVLRGVMGPERPTAAVPLAVQLQLQHPSDGRSSGAGATSQLHLHPARPGKRGDWIRTGASWNDLSAYYGAEEFEPEQRDAVLALSATAQTQSRGYYLGGPLSVDDVGPRLWRLLDDLAEVGVPLVSTRKQGYVVSVAPEPATMTLDLRRDGDHVVLRPRVRLAGADLDLADGSVRLIGHPAFGLSIEGEGRLVLARFARTLDPGIHRLATQGSNLTVPADELAEFTSEFYPLLRQRTTVESSDTSVLLPEIKPPRLALDVGFEPGHAAHLHWSYRYARPDGSDVSVAMSSSASKYPRNRGAEAELIAWLGTLDAVRALPALYTEVGEQRSLAVGTRLYGLDTIALVHDVLPALAATDRVVVTTSGEPADYTQAVEPPQISVSADDSGDGRPDWFDLAVTVTVGAEEVPFTPLFEALARGDDHLILDSGTWFRLDRPELEALRRLIEEARGLQDQPPQGLRVTPWQAGFWEELVSLGVVASQSERWQRSVGALLALDTIPTPAVPAGVSATLRHYQLDGYRWLSLLWDLRLGGILADDMGLGKTLQTLAMATRAYENGTLTAEEPLLIVAPTTVVSTWVGEAERFCPGLRVVAITETESRRGQALTDAIAGAHVVVTSYTLLRLEDAEYRSRLWSGMVLDEAQMVKNHQAKTYKAARRVPAGFKLAITGTPLENSLMDLWSLLSISAPGLFPNPQRFTEVYRKPIEGGKAPELLSTLRRRVRPLMLRRTKQEVAPDLPPKIEQVLEVTLNPQHQRIYNTHLQRERQRVLGLVDDFEHNRVAVLRALTALRQLSLAPVLVDEEYAGRCRSSKIDALMEQLTEVGAEGHRTLVFSQFTGFLRLVRDRLTEEGIAHVYLDGRTRNRQARIAEFTDGDAPVFVISLKAGGAGITLTEADYVFILDPWWNPATEAQAVDRTHRIGQHKTVMVYRLVATDTIEEKVVALQQRKRHLFDSVVDSDDLMAAPLTAADIRGLLED